MKKYENGSLTLEAAVAVPFFMVMLLLFVNVIRLVCFYEIVQNAASQTARLLAKVSYIAYASGINDFIGKMDDVLLNKLADVLPADAPGNAPGDASDSILESGVKELLSDILGKSFENIGNDLLQPLVKYCFNYYLNSENAILLKNYKGPDSIDLSGSNYNADNGGSFEIIVRYRTDILEPFDILDDFVIVQRAAAKAWLGGDGDEGATAGRDSVWSLDNFSRGRIIRKQFGANLPDSFPVISAYSDGKAILIKSMDVLSPYYENSGNIVEEIRGYISELVSYRGTEKPWGNQQIVIGGADIHCRELLLVIPEDPLLSGTQDALNACGAYAREMGVVFRIERYGTKNVPGNIK